MLCILDAKNLLKLKKRVFVVEERMVALKRREDYLIKDSLPVFMMLCSRITW